MTGFFKKLIILSVMKTVGTKQGLFFILMLLGLSAISQEDEKAKREAQLQAQSYVYTGNELLSQDDFVSAEMEYRKAISQEPGSATGAYNLGNSYYEKGDFDEALYRQQQALKQATTKQEKHYAYHNIGNILMQSKKCKEAAEAFKNALKNAPTDDETRYNYALAKECAEQQEQQQDQENKDNQDQQDQQDQEQQDKKDQSDQNKDQQDQDKKEQQDEGQEDQDGEQKEDQKQEPNQEKPDDKEGDQEQKQQPQQQPGQLSPQQVKNLLEAMNAQEQKTQEKINAEKQKGIKIKTDKDW